MIGDNPQTRTDKPYTVIFKINRGEKSQKETINARNCSDAVKKIKNKYDTTHIIRVEKCDPLRDLKNIFGM